MKGWERKQVLGAGGGGGRRGLGTARLGAGHTVTTHRGGAHTGVPTRGCTRVHGAHTRMGHARTGHTHSPVLPLHLKETAARQSRLFHNLKVQEAFEKTF